MRSDPEGIALREGDYEYAWGVAAFTFPDGTKYVGEWRDGEFVEEE